MTYINNFLNIKQLIIFGVFVLSLIGVYQYYPLSNDFFNDFIFYSLPYIGLYVLMFIIASLLYNKFTNYNVIDEIKNHNHTVSLSFFGYIGITMFLIIETMKGDSYNNMIQDMILTFMYFFIIQLVFLLGRNLLTLFVLIIHKDSLNDEIKNQKNYAATLLELSIYTFLGFVLSNYDFFMDYQNIQTDIYFTIISILSFIYIFIVYEVFFTLKYKFVEQMLHQDNPSAGIVFFGYILGFSLIINNQFVNITNLPLIEMCLYTFTLLTLSIVLMYILQFILVIVVKFIYKIDIIKESFENKNIFTGALLSLFFISSAQFTNILIS